MPEERGTSSAAEVPQLAEHLFRQESGKLVSVLTGIFGIDRLQLAEDVVQEALVRALQVWPFYGVPKNPAAWLMQTARNLALDLIRREKRFHEKQPEIIATIEQRLSEPGPGESPLFDDEIRDGRLRLIFACCHPQVPQESQIALALKTLCGFSPAEIASAFLTSEAAIAKRLTRARQSIQEQGIPFEIPSGEELAPRLDGVLRVIYLLFNEGYKASRGESLVRADLCEEAIRLAKLLAGHAAGNQPRTHALIALMLLDTARLSSRTDAAGKLLLLHEQDRATWDRDLIALGVQHLAQASRGGELSEYHLQAGIAAFHCTAADESSTDWAAILAQYDAWLEINDSPIVALNRAVALAKVEGPRAGLRALASLSAQRPLDSYYLTHAVLGEFEAQLGNFQTATRHLQRALQLAEVKSEQTFLMTRMRDFDSR